MREIKFRAWVKDEKRMLAGQDLCRIIANYHGLNNEEWANLEMMQFTGLKDKNGKEIFEGDVVRDSEYRRLTVRFNTEGDFYGLCFQGIITVFQNPSPKVIDKYGIEIIGNIYENPELIGEK